MRRVFVLMALLALAGCGGSGAGFTLAPHDNGGTDGGVVNPPAAGEPFSLSVLRDPSGVPTGVRVSWQRVPVDNIDGYWIYRSTTADGLPDGDPAGYSANRVTASIIAQSGSGTETLHHDDLFTLDVGDTFYYRMTVVNSTHDESDFSNQLSITIAEQDITDITTTPVSIGDQVTINGHHFGASRSGDQVFFSNHAGSVNVEAATYDSWSDTQIVVTVPYGAADGPLGVKIGGTQVDSVDDVSYIEPNLTAVDPVEDYVQHSNITLTGNDFGDVQSGGGYNSYVYFGTTQCQAADIVSWNNAEIICKVPAAATGTNVNVKVVVADNESNTQAFLLLPHIDSINPASGNTGSSVTITGTNFGTTQGSGIVRINAVTCSVSSWANDSITATIPSTALDGNITVRRSDNELTNGVGFDVVPAITGISPARRQVGQQLTISGSGFGSSQDSSTVHFNGGNVDAANYISWTYNQIVVEVPAGAATGTVTVNIADNSVGDNNDAATSSGSVTVVLAPPDITGIGQI